MNQRYRWFGLAVSVPCRRWVGKIRSAVRGPEET
jgi:hypothetical protein